MIRLGVDLDKLGPQFDKKVHGRTLIMDGDAACYRASSTCKTLDTALRRYVKIVLETMFMADCGNVRLHLTSRKSRKANRCWYPTVLPYQGNRGGKPKPPLLEPLRNAIAHHASLEDGKVPLEWAVFLHDYWEADDGIITDSYHYGDNGLVWSEDKDMRLCRGPYYEISTGKTDYIDNPFGWISEDCTEGGTLKAKGHGTKFFWWQMLAGDTADNVKGITELNGKLCGARGALNFLMPIQDENEAANKIIWEYAKSDQQFLPEAEVLWLRRFPEDSAYKYISSLDLDKDIRIWLEQQNNWHERIFQEHFEEEDDGWEID